MLSAWRRRVGNYVLLPLAVIVLLTVEGIPVAFLLWVAVAASLTDQGIMSVETPSHVVNRG